MVTKLFLINFFVLSIPVLADTLVGGSVYFDSQSTLEEVVKLSAKKDNESILKLINNGHVSQQIGSAKEIVVLTTGSTPESPAEFRFASEPTTYWTLTKFVAKSAEQTANPVTTPAAANPVTTPTVLPAQAPSPTAVRKQHETESENPLDDDNGHRIWHKVDGKWKWYPANKHRVPVKKALPPE